MLHFKFRSLERPAYFQRKLRGPRRVAVHADRLDIGTRGKAGHSSQNLRRVMNNRTRFASRHQSAVSTIRAVGERFTGCLKSGGPPGRDKLGAWEADQNQGLID